MTRTIIWFILVTFISVSSLFAQGEYNNSLEIQYQSFVIKCKVFGKDNQVAYDAFDELLLSYKDAIMMLDQNGIDGYFASNNIDIDILTYDQCHKLIYQWRIIVNEIIGSYGKDYYDRLIEYSNDKYINEFLSHYPKWKDGYVLKKNRGTLEENYFYEVVLNICFDRIREYEESLSVFLSQVPLRTSGYSDYIFDINRTLSNKGYSQLGLSLLIDVFYNTVNLDGRSVLTEEFNVEIMEIALTQGLYDLALDFITTDIAIQEFQEGSTYSDIVPYYTTPELYVRKLLAIAWLYSMEGAYQQKLKYSLIAESVLKNNVVEFHDVYLSKVYRNLASIYCLNNEYEKANEYQIRAIKLIDVFDSHYAVGWPAMLYQELAEIYLSGQEYDKAQEVLKKCIEHCSQPSDEGGDRLLPSMYGGLMEACWGKKQYDAMNDAAIGRYLSELKYTRKQLFGMNKRNRTDLYTHSAFSMLFEYNSGYALKNSLMTGLCYDISLTQKGFLLNYESDIYNNVKKLDNVELSRNFKKYRDAEIAQSDSTMLYEKIFLENYSEFEQLKLSEPLVTWEDVRNKLNINDMTIEYTKCLKDSSTSYAALILKKEYDSPLIIELCSESEIVHIISTGSKLYHQNDEAYSYIWEKLEPYLNGVENIYFAPHGLIHQMNIEVLAGKDGIPMNKKYKVYRVSSTGNLVDKREDSEYPSATLFGGLNYDTDTMSLVEMSRTYAHIYPFRDRLLRDTVRTRAGWSYLPGTATEVKNVSTILRKNKVKTRMFTDEIGTEESFKALSGNSPSIIHIATHGFYLEDKTARRVELFSSLEDRGTTQISPLKRSGLMFSGGQHAWLGKDIPEGIDDGVLTAEEIAGMNLSGTDMLVLSACQTGLGEITSSGVEGLQKGFKIAGVNTIIMSLWEVSDVATETMMTTFYKNLTKGKRKRESFDKAVEAVKKKYPSPEYWAAFIMLD